jgi:hypothetical protein
MIAVALALVRSFLSDRVAVVLTLVAPAIFVTLLGTFYRHLESPDGIRIELTVVDEAGNVESARMVEAIRVVATPPVSVVDAGDRAGRSPRAEVVVPAGFSADRPAVSVKSEIPLPGGNAGLRQMLELAARQAFAPAGPALEVAIDERPGRLVRDSIAGICLVFMMFSVSSIAARGLADDAAGLRDRLRSLGIGRGRYDRARVLAMSSIAWLQMTVAFGAAAIVFAIVPVAPVSLVAATMLAATSTAAAFHLLATVCGGRSRFAAAAPVVTLVLGALSGGLIPRFVLPSPVARVGDFLFPAWAIDACRAGLDGRWDVPALAGLVVVTVLATFAAGRWPTGDRRA